MIRREALDILEHNWTRLVNPDYSDKELGEALDIAIKALSAIDDDIIDNHTGKESE